MHNKMAGGKFSSKKIRSNQLRFFIAASWLLYYQIASVLLKNIFFFEK
jgi:hypothetical protein